MAYEKQTTGTHKTMQNARITSNARGTPAIGKLSNTVEDLQPPADATALTLANYSMADDNEWRMMNCKGKLDTEMEEATNQREQQRGRTPKRKETSNTATMPMTTLE
eukprot:2775421-Ditylum_brightwellii.AAC.1